MRKKVYEAPLFEALRVELEQGWKGECRWCDH